MIDVLPRSHSAIFAAPEQRRLKPSFYWALAFAVLLHVALVAYLVQQNFTIPAVETPEPPGIVITMPTLPAPPPTVKTSNPPKSVPLHTPLTIFKTDVKPLNTTPTNTSASASASSGPVTNLGGTPGTADKGPATTGPVYVNPTWTAFPDADALSQYYPARATDDEREGTATVECTVMNAQGQVNCTSIAETPRGYGFGAATARMIGATGRVDTTKGDVKVGSKLHATVSWKLQ